MVVLLVALHNGKLFAQVKKDYLITNYVAIRDGKTLNTAIQKVIDVAAENGGGKAILPLYSNVFHLAMSLAGDVASEVSNITKTSFPSHNIGNKRRCLEKHHEIRCTLCC